MAVLELITAAKVPKNTLAFARLVPLIVISVPRAAEVGEKLAIVGNGKTTVNTEGLKPTPTSLATPIKPDVAPFGTVTVILLFVLAVTVAGVPLNDTEVGFNNDEPLIVIVVPTTPLFGVTAVITGAVLVMINGSVVVKLPLGVVTLTGPVVVPVATVAVITVKVGSTVRPVTVTPLIVTIGLGPKLDPFIVIIDPSVPEVGDTKLMIGEVAVSTVKLLAEVPVPEPLVTVIGPEVAVAGTTNCKRVAPSGVKVAFTPFNLTEETPLKLAPLTSTVVPARPLAGSKFNITGTVVTARLK